MTRWIQRWMACAWVAAAACASALPSADAGGSVDWGPFYSRLAAPDGSVSTRALGPLFERRAGPGADAMVAVRPLYARATNSANRRIEGELLWPVGEFSAMGTERAWRVLLAWYRCFDTTADHPRWRLWILPVYFQGRNAAGDNYAAVFPFGGRISEFLGRDDCRFVLWPVWTRTTVDDMETLDVLYPLYGVAHGTRTDRFRLFPFYGRAVHYGNCDKRFILWPFWNEAAFDSPTSKGSGFILFPFYGRIDLSDESSWMLLPPLFRVTRGAEVNRIQAPWPFFQMESGRRNRFHVWPLFGRTTDPGVDRSYLAWPILWRSRVYRGDMVSRSYWAAPLLYAETRRDRRSAPDAPPEGRRWKVWPLASYAREREDVRFRTLALWPTRDFACIERSWAPLWTLADYRRAGSDADTEILWGMFRRSVRGETSARTSLFPLVEWTGDAPAGEPACREVSLLKGLLGYRWGGVGRELRILYGVRIGLGGPGPSSSTNQTISNRR